MCQSNTSYTIIVTERKTIKKDKNSSDFILKTVNQYLRIASMIGKNAGNQIISFYDSNLTRWDFQSVRHVMLSILYLQWMSHPPKIKACLRFSKWGRCMQVQFCNHRVFLMVFFFSLKWTTVWINTKKSDYNRNNADRAY